MKKIITSIIFILMLVPIVLVYCLSVNEMKQYDNNIKYDFTEKALGEIYVTERRNIKEYYQVSGEFVSGESEIVELAEGRNYLYIKLEDEVSKDEIIGYDESKEAIKSPCNGIVSEINVNDQYVRIDSSDKVLLKCKVDENRCKDILSEKKLFTAKGEIVKVNKISNICEDGYRSIYFEVKNNKYMVGQNNKKFKLYTGNVYKNVLTIENDCVYQKDDGMNYVRLVDGNGEFLNEEQVEVSYSNDKYTCITGIEENCFCDSGYKILADIEE